MAVAPEPGSWLPTTKRTGLIVVVGGAVVIIANWFPDATTIDELRDWARAGGAAAMVGFGAAYVALALLLVPGAALTMAAGAVFGMGWGLVLVAVATTVADAAAFLIGRHLAREAVVRLQERYPRLGAFDRALSRGGWRIVALIRLNPAFPYSASNYVFGASGIAVLPFLVASGVFTLPGALAYVYLGYVGAEVIGSNGRGLADWALLALGLLLTVLAVWYLATLARREMAAIERGQPSRTLTTPDS